MGNNVQSIIEDEVVRLNSLADKNHQIHEYKFLSVIDEVEEFLLRQKGDISVETLQYNIPFWVQAILRKPGINLRIDDPSQTFYEVQSDRVLPFIGNKAIDSLISLLPDRALWGLFVKNLGDIARQFEFKRDDIMNWGEKEHCVLLSNHATWLNLPFIAYCLHAFVGVPKEDIYILLGPAITTNAFGMSGSNRFANIIKTVPDTPRGNIEYNGIDSIRKKALRTILKLVRETDTSRKFLLIAPSGTTDQYESDTGKFILTRPSQGTRDFISLLSSQTSQMIVGMNDYAVYPGNTSLKRGNVYPRISLPTDTNKLPSLPEYVVDENYIPVGQWK